VLLERRRRRVSRSLFYCIVCDYVRPRRFVVILGEKFGTTITIKAHIYNAGGIFSTASFACVCVFFFIICYYDNDACVHVYTLHATTRRVCTYTTTGVLSARINCCARHRARAHGVVIRSRALVYTFVSAECLQTRMFDTERFEYNRFLFLSYIFNLYPELGILTVSTVENHHRFCLNLVNH